MLNLFGAVSAQMTFYESIKFGSATKSQEKRAVSGRALTVDQ